MTRPIKFRAWHKPTKSMLEVKQLDLDTGSSDRGHTFYEPRAESPHHPYYRLNVDDCIPMQFTGLTDKNWAPQEVYEGDIVSPDGKVIGNEHENSDLLKDKANLLIQGFGTGAWLTTYAEAVERGCHDAE